MTGIERRDSLPPIDQARAMIARAVAVGDVDTLVDLRNSAEAIDLYFRRSGAKEVADQAGEIKVTAERAIGRIDTDRAPRGRPRNGKR